MISGYNTEITYGDTIYHIQTEDMGMEYKKIITHVFKGGAILLSKKTPYDSLLVDGYDEAKIKSLMNDQHKTILKIIRSGKLEVLRKKVEEAEETERNAMLDTAEKAAAIAEREEKEEEIKKSTQQIEQEVDASLNAVLQQFIDRHSGQKKLKIEVVAGTEIVAGQPAVLRIYTKDSSSGEPIADARIVVKVIGMTFRPAIYSGHTDKNGVFALNMIVPEFSMGQAAIIVQASSTFGNDELKLKVSRRP